MRVVIAIIAGPHQGQVFRFSGHDVFLVGRSKKAHFRLPNTDEYFSRLHFLVEVNPPHCRLTDLGSTNGTFVNGQKVSFSDLKDADQIQGGQTVMRVTIEDGDEEPLTRKGERLPILSPAAPAPALPATPSIVPTFQTGQPAGMHTGAGNELSAACTICGSPARPAPSAEDSAQTEIPPWPLCWACLARSQHQPQPFPGYRLIRELGKGGMGVVYMALHLPNGQVVALKTITPQAQGSPVEVERFLREARILQQLDHPHIVPFREMGESCGQFYFAMDLVHGEDAARLLHRDGPMPIARAIHIVAQALAGLSYAHERKFIHRDIKPANLLVSTTEGDFVKVLDFGLARTYQMSRLSGLSVAGQVGGTVPFMPPEQILNFRDSRPPVDQFAAAATLYNLLTDRYIHDFPGDFRARLMKVLHDDAIPIRTRRADVPEPLAAAIHRALAREPADRFPDAAAFRAALLAVPL